MTTSSFWNFKGHCRRNQSDLKWLSVLLIRRRAAAIASVQRPVRPWWGSRGSAAAAPSAADPSLPSTYLEWDFCSHVSVHS